MDHPFLTKWAEWSRQSPPGGPYIFPGDEDAIEELNHVAERRSRRTGTKVELTCNYGSWEEYRNCEMLGLPSDRRLHLGLLPHPFCGNLGDARIVILLLNPGFGPLDAFSEFTNREYHDELLRNLRGEPVRGGGFMYLDTHFAWHGAFRYWQDKLRDVICKLQMHRNQDSFAGAREQLRQEIATLELVPYHAVTYGISRSIIDKMASARLARRFVHEVLLDRARQGKCLIIVTRKQAQWGLKRENNVVVYEPRNAQAASLSTESEGGGAILRFLQST